jgi:hypothetical protein
MAAGDQNHSRAGMTPRTFVGFTERHYTCAEIAEMWNMHPVTVRELFRNEPGVLNICASRKSRFRKSYAQYRIPASVAERVHRRLQQG